MGEDTGIPVFSSIKQQHTMISGPATALLVTLRIRLRRIRRRGSRTWRARRLPFVTVTYSSAVGGTMKSPPGQYIPSFWIGAVLPLSHCDEFACGAGLLKRMLG
jgi:hypothetical protein